MGTIQDKLNQTALCKQKIKNTIQSRYDMPEDTQFKLYPMYITHMCSAVKLPYTVNNSRFLSDPYSETNRDLEYLGLVLSSCCDDSSEFDFPEAHGGNITLIVSLPNITLNCAVYTSEESFPRRSARLVLTNKSMFLSAFGGSYTKIKINPRSWSIENFTDELDGSLTKTDVSQFDDLTSWEEGSPRGVLGTQDAFEYHLTGPEPFKYTDGSLVMRLNASLTLS